MQTPTRGNDMKRIRARVAVGLMLVVAVALAALTASARSAAPPALKNGGTLTIALESDPDALDPTLARTFVGRMVFADMCEKLYDLNAKLEIVPQLAAALPTFSDRQEDGHDQDPDRHQVQRRHGPRRSRREAVARPRPEPEGSARASELSPVASIDTQGNSTVILHLKTRYSPITAQLADRAGMIMSPKALNALGDKFATNPICVGPFMYKDRSAGDHITLTKSPFYYGKAKVHLDTIVWKIITDPAARAANLRSHDVNIAEGLASTDLQSIAHDKSLLLFKSTSIGYQGITVNIGNSKGSASCHTRTPARRSPSHPT